MLHPINVKTLKRLPDYLTGFSFSSPPSSSSFNISVFILSFRWESFFPSFRFVFLDLDFCCLSAEGEKKRLKYIHENSLWGLVALDACTNSHSTPMTQTVNFDLVGAFKAHSEAFSLRTVVGQSVTRSDNVFCFIAQRIIYQLWFLPSPLLSRAATLSNISRRSKVQKKSLRERAKNLNNQLIEAELRKIHSYIGWLVTLCESQMLQVFVMIAERWAKIENFTFCFRVNKRSLERFVFIVLWCDTWCNS